jgi:hypothetical protein
MDIVKSNFSLYKLSPHVLTLLTAFCLLLYALSPKAIAQSFKLQIDDINTAPDKKVPTPFLKSPSPTDQEDDKKLQPGIQHIYQSGPISFLVDSDILDFGQITSSNPVIRSITLSATSESINYRVLTYEDHPPRTINNQEIPNTTCDDGSCNQSQSAHWENNLTYGFGLRCISKSILYCIGNFDKDYYRQFANISSGEEFMPIINGIKHKNANDIQMSLKINASGTQEPGIYSNTVTFIMVPNY